MFVADSYPFVVQVAFPHPGKNVMPVTEFGNSAMAFDLPQSFCSG